MNQSQRLYLGLWVLPIALLTPVPSLAGAKVKSIAMAPNARLSSQGINSARSHSGFRKLAALKLPRRSPVNFAASRNAAVLAKFEPSITIELAFDEQFFSSPEALDYLRYVSDYVPPRQATFGIGDTLNGLVANEYAIGVKHPELTAALVTTILKLNNLADVNAVPLGNLLIPNFPADPAPIQQKYRKSASGSDALVNVNGIGDGSIRSAFSKNIQLARPLRMLGLPSADHHTASPASASSALLPRSPFVQRITVPRSLADSIFANQIFEQLTNVKAVYLNGDSTILLEDSSQPKSGVAFPVELRTDCLAAATLANQGAKRRALLVIQDAGWAQLSDRNNAYEYFFSLFDQVWRYLGQFPSPYKRAIPSGSLGTPFIHCTQIAEALECFDWRNSKSVQTVFLPLSKDQGANELLLELLHLYFLVQTSVPNMAGDFSAPNRGEIDKAKQDAAKVLSRIPDSITSYEIKTDYALIAAPLQVLSYYALREPDFFFVLNYSWTVPHRSYQLTFPSPLCGSLITAAGNAGRNVLDFPYVDFASRCSSGNDTFCVANYSFPNGIRSGSSFLGNDAYLSRDRYLGFDGSIAGESATSFASPRVAWLIAAANSVRPFPIRRKAVWWDWMRAVVNESKEMTGVNAEFLLPSQIIKNAITKK